MTKNAGFAGPLFEGAIDCAVRPAGEDLDLRGLEIDKPRRLPSQRAKGATAEISTGADRKAEAGTKGDGKGVSGDGRPIPTGPVSAFRRLEWLVGVANGCANVAALRMAIVLALRAGDGTSTRKVKTLAGEVGLSERGGHRGLKRLVAEGFVLRDDGKGGRGLSNKTYLALPENHAKTDMVSEPKTMTGLVVNHVKPDRNRPIYPSIGTKQRTQRTDKPEADPASKNGKTNPWGLWVDANLAIGRKKPTPEGPDTAAAKRFAGLVPDPAELRAVFDAYLRDTDKWLTDRGHSLRFLSGRIDRYRNGSPSSGGGAGGAAGGAAAEETAHEAALRIARELKQ